MIPSDLVARQVLTDSVAQLTQAVVARLRVASVEAGVGVDAATMEVCPLLTVTHPRYISPHCTPVWGLTLVRRRV
jgi:hypothetical protein